MVLTMTWTTTTIFGLFFLIGSFSADKVPRIIGGSDAEIKDFPFLVSIRSFGDHTCGGTIISDRHILTAGHCAYDKLIQYLTVHSGVSRSDEVGHKHMVAAIDIHPTYKERNNVNGTDDIAVLTLKEPINFDKYQRKINVTSRDVQKYDSAYAVGWGRTSKTNWNNGLLLQKLKVAMIPSDICNHFLTKTTIDEKQVCIFRSSTTGVCHGDSGSTLVSHGEIVGIASRIDTGICAVGTPDIYNNVFYYKDFIDSVVNK